MKKTLSALLALFVSLSSFAQMTMPDQYLFEEEKPDPMLFNHMAVGVDLLSLNGLGLQLALPVTQHFQLRAGFDFMDLHMAIANGIVKGAASTGNIDALKNGINPFSYSIQNVNIDEDGIKVDQVDLSATFQSRNLNLLFDLYPGKNTIFHFTVGAFFSLAPKGLLTASATALYKGENAISPADRTKTEVMGITTDKDGRLQMAVQYKLNAVRPYFGIGTGRPVSPDRRVSVAFDLGVQYTGGIKLVSYNYMGRPDNPEKVYLDGAWLDKYPETRDYLGEDYDKAKKIMDILDHVPVTPVLKLSLFVRLF